MKKLSTILSFVWMCLSIGCSEPYDDSAIRYDIEDLKERVAKLEELCGQMNNNISSLQAIVAALQNQDYITSVTPITENGVTIGYTITFAKGTPITIYHGQDGKDGANGNDGKDGYTPIIGVKQDTDGIYYWTLDGEWLLDENGNKIKAQGTDGKDGQNGADGEDGKDGANGNDGANGSNGQDGKDGITPQLKIENDYWYISYDNGTTWTQLGKATGEKGEQGEQGPQGDKGDKGDTGLVGDSMFTDVDYSNEDYVLFTLSNGTVVKVPTWSAFEALRTLCNQMNSNIGALQTIVAALQNNDYVTKVEPVVENGTTIGYTIYFTKSNPVTIYHGQDGKDGANGNDGKDGYTPIISVKQDADGIYYWTLDGEWLLDESGNKIKAQGTDGKDGQNGADGEDGKDGANGNDGANGYDGATGPQGPQGEQGITPQLKIENDYWYVSYDNGVSWEQLGKATGEDGKDGADGKDGDSFFQSVTQDEQYVYFTLADGTVITLPKGASLEITFAESDLVVMEPNTTREIGYTVQSVTESVTVEVTSSSDLRAKVVPSSADGKSGDIVVTSSGVVDEYSKVIVFVSNGEKVIMKSISFEQAGITISNGAEQTINAKGGNINLNFAANIDWEVAIPAEAQSWIQVAPQTRAMVTYTVVLNIAPNTTLSERSAAIKIISTDGNLSISYTISQGVFDNVMVTTVNDAGWKTDDSISIFAATSINQRYTYYGASGVTTGAFLAPKSETNLPAPIDAYYAIYPYNASYALNADGEIVNTFASEQKYIAGGYKWGYNLMVGASSGVDDKNITLSPVCAYLCVRLYGKEQIVKSITINSNGGEALAGSALITPSNEGAHHCAMTGSIDNIKLNCGEVLLAETADAASEFWFVVPPVTLANGYSVKVAGFYGGEQVIDFPATTFASGATYSISAEITVATDGPGMGVGGWGDGENIGGEI
ncbi:MAG: hypothetical protein II299_07510 [Alistipes sp.]|nr:hypothetical protein [Alistipes sp.]